MIQRTLALFACGTFTALFACSSDAGDKYPSVDSFCAARADALCANVATGCGTTADKCKPSETALCIAQSNALGRSYRPAGAEDCINQTSSVYAKKTVTATDETSLATTCNNAFPGTAAKAAKCNKTADCAESLVCDAINKTCATKTDRKLEDECNNAGDTCETGTYCQLRGVRASCTKKNDVGAICTDASPCLETLQCSGGSCRAKANIGEACAQDADCSSTAGAPYCDALSKQCKQRFTGGTQSCKDIGG